MMGTYLQFTKPELMDDIIEYIFQNGQKYGYIINKKKGTYLIGDCNSFAKAIERRNKLINYGFNEESIKIHPNDYEKATKQELRDFNLTNESENCKKKNMVHKY